MLRVLGFQGSEFRVKLRNGVAGMRLWVETKGLGGFMYGLRLEGSGRRVFWVTLTLRVQVPTNHILFGILTYTTLLPVAQVHDF